MFLQFSIHIQPKTQNSKPAQAQRLCVVLSTQTTSKNSVQLCPKTRLLFEKKSVIIRVPIYLKSKFINQNQH